MGIEQFYKVIKDNSRMNIVQVNAQHVYVDVNSIIYDISSEISDELNYMLYGIINNDMDRPEHSYRMIEYITKWGFVYDKTKTLEQLLSNYKTYFTKELINDMKLIKIKKYIEMICTKYVNQEFIEYLYMAMDGIPQMCKVLEQKKRRYRKYTMNYFKNKIDKSSIGLNEQRKLYEANRIRFKNFGEKNDEHIFDICDILIDDKFIAELKLMLPYVKKICVSSMKTSGEGEKKIMDDIITNKKKGSYVIYSPDNDVVLLSALMMNILNNMSTFYVIHYDKNAVGNERVDIINVKSFVDNLYNYFKSIRNEYSNMRKYNRLNVMNDILYTFTIFGNDFLPRLESISAKNHSKLIINIYYNVLQFNERNLVQYIRGKYVMNYNFFRDFFVQLVEYENELFCDNYLQNTYKNIGYLRKVFGDDRIYMSIRKYVELANKVYASIYSDSEISDIIKIFYKDNGEFHEKFAKIFIQIEDNDSKFSHRQVTKYDVELFLKKMRNIKMVPRMHLAPMDKVIDAYHIDNIRKRFAHPKIPLVDYDVRKYKLERNMNDMIDSMKIDKRDFDLGKITLSVQNNQYVLIENINNIDNISNYYNTFIKESSNENIENVVKEYIKGLFWLFDWYFNKNNTNENNTKISIWMFPYYRAPLLSDIANFLKKYTTIKSFHTELDEFLIDRKNYLNPDEHYTYISVFNTLSQHLIDKYAEINQNKHIFPDMNNYLDKVDEKIIDCRGMTFFNRCNLIGIDIITFDEYIKQIRKNEHNNINDELHVWNFS